jgi:hypothetical protein
MGKMKDIAILVSGKGLAFEVGRSHHSGNKPWKKGMVVGIPYHCDKGGNPTSPNWAAVSVEIPRELPHAPPGVVKEVWAIPAP